MRRKPYFLCAPAQVIGWVGRSPATVRPSSSAHDYNCVGDAATSEFHNMAIGHRGLDPPSAYVWPNARAEACTVSALGRDGSVGRIEGL